MWWYTFAWGAGRCLCWRWFSWFMVMVSFSNATLAPAMGTAAKNYVWLLVCVEKYLFISTAECPCVCVCDAYFKIFRFGILVGRFCICIISTYYLSESESPVFTSILIKNKCKYIRSPRTRLLAWNTISMWVHGHAHYQLQQTQWRCVDVFAVAM